LKEKEGRDGAQARAAMGNKSWDDVLLEERESNSRLRAQQRDQAERERRLVERLAQLKEQQHALQQGKTVDAVGRDGKIKALQVGRLTPPSDACTAHVALRSSAVCFRERTRVLNRNECLCALAQDQLASLNQQNKELESKLQAAKAGHPGGGGKSHGASPSSAAAGARSSRPSSAARGQQRWHKVALFIKMLHEWVG